jgi:hypothetical protein
MAKRLPGRSIWACKKKLARLRREKGLAMRREGQTVPEVHRPRRLWSAEENSRLEDLMDQDVCGQGLFFAG